MIKDLPYGVVGNGSPFILIDRLLPNAYRMGAMATNNVIVLVNAIVIVITNR